MPHFTLHSFKKAILHIDGDNFFASCEIAKNPSLRGRAVVTGKERGIATAMSPEAKAHGVKRGMPIHTIRALSPDIIILPSDYETYSIYARRMYEIVRRYTPEVEEYSIDECFADITGFRKYHGMSYQKIAMKIKEVLDEELGMTFSVGLGVNKITAKIASSHNKPNGFAAIPGYSIEPYLSKLPIEKVWGIGPSTSEFLKRFKIFTALEFALSTPEFMKTHLHKPQHDIWKELRGEFVLPLTTVQKHDYQSISKLHTFTPSSSSRSFVFSQLSKNIEAACVKLRAHGLVTKSVFFLLKTQDMRTEGLELTFSVATCVPADIIKAVSEQFDEIYDSRKVYRATGIVLMKLGAEESMQMDLFGKSLRVKEISTVYQQIDKITQKFGKQSLFLGSSMEALANSRRLEKENRESRASSGLFDGVALKKRLGLLTLGKVH